jgi:uncharacterized metal-binding protein YceD (DUF177 family)
MIVQPEFSRRIPVGRIGSGGIEQTIEASSQECRALAERLQLPAVASFSCRFVLSPARQGRVVAEAELRAEITQTCVVSLEPFEATVSERFTLHFVPEGREPESGEDLDIDPDLPDELAYADDAIDIGEAATEQLALALDPYPRMPGIALPALDDAQEASSDPPHPFGALARLRGGPGSGGPGSGGPGSGGSQA